MRQAPHSYLQERTNLPNTLSNVAAGEVRTPFARHLELGVRRRAETEQPGTRSRSSTCTHHPGCSDSPKGADALDVSEAAYQHILPSGRAVDAGLYRRPSLDPRPAVPTTTVQAPQPKESSQRLFRLVIGAALTLMLPPPRDASPQNQRPRATRQPKPQTRTKPNSRLVPYRLDTPTPPTVARR